MHDDALSSASERNRLVMAAADRLGGVEELSTELGLGVADVRYYENTPEQIPLWVARACQQVLSKAHRA